MRKSFISSYLGIFFLFIAFFSNAQSAIESQALSSAKSMNITTQQQALDALRKQGISEGQARQMARMRGVDFDSFLNTYFSNSSNTNLQANALSNTNSNFWNSINSNNNVVDSIKIQSVLFADTITKFDTTLNILIKKDSIDFFGYDIFLNNPFARKEYLVGNIDEGYIIAPGDVLRLVVFGDNAIQIEAKVDLNGNITIPNFGVFMAAGNSFGSLKSRLKIYLGKYFSGLLTSPQRTFLDVSLTQIRPVSITVLGEANTPGPHLVSGLATVLNALYAAGGIKTSGTLRSIKVYRNNQLLKEIDLYDYITSGKLDNDIRLANNDIIFIAPRISNISLGGTVKSAAIYELKKNEGLNELIKFSGGLPANASLNNVNIQRIIPFESRDQKRIYDKFLTSVNYLGFLKSKKNFILENGDSVFFSSILNKSINQVVIIGNVNKPGAYSLDKFNNLKDLIVYGAENILPNTYLNKVDIFKEDLEGNKRFITYNLNTVLNGEVKVSLENDDSVRVYNIKDVAGEKTIKISGYGTEPKTIFWRENLNLFDLIFQSTSFEELEFQSKLLSSRVDIKRFNVNTGLFDILQGSLDNLISLKNITLLPKDEVVLYSKSVYEEVNKTIIVEGFIRNPGEYKLYNNMSVEDAVLIAGGFKEYADQDSVIVYREDFDAKNGRLSTRLILPIHTKYLKGESFKNSTEFYLKNNDLVSIRKKIGTQNIKKIKIAGEVNYPGIVTLEFEKNSLNSIISNAGGLKNTANLDASFVIRNNRSLSLDLNHELNSSNEIFQDGDSLFIAPNAGTVITLGAVENESQFIWQSNKRAKYYIRNSGGKINKVASSSYLIYPSGKAVIIGFFRNPHVFPNSKIIVNRKITNLNDNRSEKNWDKISKLLTLITSSLTAAVLASKL